MIWRLLAVFFGFIYFSNTYASPYGFSLWTPVVDKDPSNLRGYRGAINYQPPSLVWQHFSVYFDAAYGHWWVADTQPNNRISIYSVAPYLRFYFVKKPTVSPYIEASIGVAYLAQTRIDDRNLGMHYAFQDQLTVGAAFGPQQNMYLALTALHYSNGSIAAYNAGITIPIVLNVGYRF